MQRLVLSATTPGRVVLFGLPFGVAMGLWNGVQDGVGDGVFMGVVSGLIFGVFMAVFMRRTLDEAAALVGDAPREQHRAACRAAMRGPVPADPDVRQLALRIAESRAEQLARHRLLSVTVFSVFAVLGLLLSISGSPWYLLEVVFFSVMIVLTLTYWSPDRLRHRLDQLRAEPQRG